jgi:hypothetical protein
VGPVHEEEDVELVELPGEGRDREHDGGGGGDVVYHGQPDPCVPLADLHHLLHYLLLGPDGEPDRLSEICFVSSPGNLRSRQRVLAPQRFTALSMAMLQAL